MSSSNIYGNNGGYIALISAIVISILLLTVTFSLSFSGFFARFNILGSEYKQRSLALAEGCGDKALLKLAQDPSYSGNETITVGNDLCQIKSVTGPISSQYTITTQGKFQNVFTNIQILADSTDFSVKSWKELPN